MNPSATPITRYGRYRTHGRTEQSGTSRIGFPALVGDATSCKEGVKSQGIPTLLTWGTQHILPEDSVRRLRDLIPDIEYHELEGARHLAHYEFPEPITRS